MEESIFNFDDFTFQGISIGDNVDGWVDKNLCDKSQGYQIYVNNGSVTGFFFCINPGYNNYSRFDGLFAKSGAILDVSNMTRFSDLIKIFGEPSNQWDDGTEGSLEFKFKGERILEFSWDTSSERHKLDYLIVE